MCCRASARWPRDNKTLGRFQLTGIAPAPRGVPQIEVTFDIDANGIVHVSAKDLGTGKEQSISITASSNMSEEEIKKAVQRGRAVRRRGQEDARKPWRSITSADQLIYQSEKTLKELDAKLEAADKAKPCEEGLKKLRERAHRPKTPRRSRPKWRPSLSPPMPSSARCISSRAQDGDERRQRRLAPATAAPATTAP